MEENKKINLEEQKKIQLDILKNFKQICDENDLKYSLGGGTLLGAVRHQGYIPWDDDVDVMMPRKDYEKLLEIFNKQDNNFKLISFYNTEDYYYPFAKIVDIRTKLEETEFREIKEMGIYIDVFPIDFLPDNDKTIHKIFSKYKKLQALIGLYQVKDLNKTTNSKIKLMVKKLLLPLLENNKFNKYILQQMDAIGKKYNDTKKVACISGRYLEKEIMPSDYISDYVLLDFEDEKFKAPVGYDAYLTKHYSDYMKLPSKDKQVAGHVNNAYWR